MDTQELLQKIAKLKEAMLESSDDPEMVERYKKRIATLETQVAEAEASVQKKMEVVETKEEKKIDDVEEKLKKLVAAFGEEDDPDTKARLKKRIDELQSKISGVKEEIKDEKKELKEQNQEIKEAVKEIKSPEKEVRKQAIKKAKETKEVREEVKQSKKKRSKKLDTLMSELDKLISKSPKVRQKYKDEEGETKKVDGRSLDLERDAKRKAKPFGWRFKGKGDYRVPTASQRRKNPDAVDYEARPNRADVKRKGKVLLAEGGDVESEYAKGGGVSSRQKDGQRTAKPKGWRWKNEAIEKKLIPKTAMYKTPSKYYRNKYPDLVYYEDRTSKSDAKPSKKYISL